MEASMHGLFNKSGETVKSIYRNWGIGVFALPVLLVALLIGFTIAKPDMSNWISEAAQAEFVGAGSVPEAAPTQPAKEIRTVKAF
jgi:cell division protein FtsX